MTSHNCPITAVSSPTIDPPPQHHHTRAQKTVAQWQLSDGIMVVVHQPQLLVETPTSPTTVICHFSLHLQPPRSRSWIWVLMYPLSICRPVVHNDLYVLSYFWYILSNWPSITLMSNYTRLYLTLHYATKYKCNTTQISHSEHSLLIFVTTIYRMH